MEQEVKNLKDEICNIRATVSVQQTNIHKSTSLNQRLIKDNKALEEFREVYTKLRTSKHLDLEIDNPQALVKRMETFNLQKDCIVDLNDKILTKNETIKDLKEKIQHLV